MSRSNKLMVKLTSFSNCLSLIRGGNYRKSPSRIILYGLRNNNWEMLYCGILAASSTMITGDSYDCSISVWKCLSIMVVVDNNNLEFTSRWRSNDLKL